MCTGLELAAIGAATMGGGAYLQNRAMTRKADAADDAAMAGLLRQEAYDREKGDVYAETLGDIQQNMSTENRAQKASEATADIASNVSDRDVTYQNAAVDGPRVLQTTADTQKAEGDAYLDQLADARGRLAGWTGAQMDLADQMSKHSWDVDRLSGDALRDAQLAQLETQHAYNSTGNKTALAGNLGTQLGGMLLTQGAFNMGLGALQGAGSGAGTVHTGTGAIKPNAGLPMATPTYDPYGTLRVVA